VSSGAWELLEDEDGAPYPEELQEVARDRVIAELVVLRDDLIELGFSVSGQLITQRIEALRGPAV